MLGTLIYRYRKDRNITQAQLAEKLTSNGWEMRAAHVAKLELEAVRDIPRHYTNEQLEALVALTGYSRWLCYFWAGQIPSEVLELAEKRHAPDEIVHLATALLCGALGVAELGPEITEDAIDRLGLGKPMTEQEHALVEIRSLNDRRIRVTTPQEKRITELRSLLEQKAPPRPEPEGVKAVLNAWGDKRV